MKVLFFHNTLAVYRIHWFLNLARSCDIRFVITNEMVNRKNYHIDNSNLNLEEIECTFITPGPRGFIEISNILKSISEWDYVVLPPVDSLHEYIISEMILFACKRCSIRTCYFWEKWEAPKDRQPIQRRIKNLLSNTFAGKIYCSVDAVFTVGRKSREYFIKHGVIEKKIIIIPDVSETSSPTGEDVRNIYHIERNKILVLYFGRIMKEKGLDVLIKSFAELKDLERYYLLIAGGGDDIQYKTYCKQLVHELGLNNNCCFVGRVSPEKRGDFFSSCNVFVFPATYRNGWVDVWGLTVNEAIQHGKPVVATKAVGSAYELIFEGQNGFVVEPEDIPALAYAIEKASKNEMTELTTTKDIELSNIYTYKNMAKTFLKGLNNISSISEDKKTGKNN